VKTAEVVLLDLIQSAYFVEPGRLILTWNT